MGKYLRYFKDSSKYEDIILYRPSISYFEDKKDLLIEDYSGRLSKDGKFIKFYDELFEPNNFIYKCENLKKEIINGFKEMTYDELSTFIKENTLPKSIYTIGIYYKDSLKRFGEIDCLRKKSDNKEKLYSFGVLSDIHNQTDQYAECDADIKKAIKFLEDDEKVDFTCICGDITLDGTLIELERYKNNIDTCNSNKPIYVVKGNHDAQNDGLNDDIWERYTNCKRNYVITKNNDVFIFFSLAKYSLGREGTPYSDDGIDWLRNQLNTYKNNRVFIFTHLFFPDKAGHFKEIYNHENSLRGREFFLLKQLRNHFPNAIWFSGHSHWKWYLQQYQENANIDKDNSWTVHISSCAYPIDSKSEDGGLTWSRDTMPLESEGAIVDVYDDYVEIRSFDLKNKLCLPNACYKLDTKLENNITNLSQLVEPSYPNMNDIKYISSKDIIINQDKDGSNLIEITDLENNYVLLKFYILGSGVLAINSDEYKIWESTKIKLLVEDAQISYDGINFTSNIPSKLGFYKDVDNDYTLSSCEDMVDLRSKGHAQINVSSRYTSELPVYIKIKCKLAYK